MGARGITYPPTGLKISEPSNPANRWGTTNSEPLLDQLLGWANQKHSVVVRSYLLHSSLHEPCTSHSTLCNYAQPKPISWAKPAYFDFASSNFILQDHILSTIGDALTALLEHIFSAQINFTIIFHPKYTTKAMFLLLLVV
jgi:hypothetical protein